MSLCGHGWKPYLTVRLVTALLLLIVLAGMSPANGLAGVSTGRTGNGCPVDAVCDHALGVAVTPPASWRLLPAGKLPPHTIGLYALPVTGPSYNLRLIIASDGTTRQSNDQRAGGQ